MSISGWYDVKRWLLGFGSSARVVKPEEKHQPLPVRISFDETVLGKDAFLKYNHALILTCPGKISGMGQ